MNGRLILCTCCYFLLEGGGVTLPYLLESLNKCRVVGDDSDLKSEWQEKENQDTGYTVYLISACWSCPLNIIITVAPET